MTASGAPVRQGGASFADLTPRLLSALVLAPVVVLAAWLGGWVAAVMVAIVTAIVLQEWAGIASAGQDRPLVRELVLLVSAASLAAGAGMTLLALVIAAAGILAALAARDGWLAVGVLYAAAFGIALLALRLSPQGLAALAFVIAVVWATDTGAFAVGRTVGGPKLWPLVSPKKTWSGFLGGLAVGVGAGIVVSALVVGPKLPGSAAVALILSLASQAGDLAESALKRRFGAKDSGHLIPGHGGLMDRVDGLVFAVVAAALIGWLHGGTGRIGEGLLLW
jgi:phosphatidate cytidylyltransferase